MVVAQLAGLSVWWGWYRYPKYIGTGRPYDRTLLISAPFLTDEDFNEKRQVIDILRQKPGKP